MSNTQIKPFFEAVRVALDVHLSEVLCLRATRTKKTDGSYVTEGDLLVQKLVMEAAAVHLPLAKVISEELKGEAHDAMAGVTIVVDPIDGTENFTSGLPEWGVSICCYDNGAHAGSLIGCPEMSQWISTGDSFERHESRIRGLSSSLTKEDILRATGGFEYRVMGCCVYNMMNVIRGSYLSFENPKGAHSWDILAGVNLALEHGLQVNVNGKVYHGQYLSHTEKYRFKIEG